MNEIYNPVGARADQTPAPAAPAAVLPRLRGPAPEQAAELDRLLDEGDRERAGDRGGEEDDQPRPTARIPDEPRLEVRPYLLAAGDRLTVEGRGWVCEDGSRPPEVTIELGEGGPVLGTAEPNRRGEFEERLRLPGRLIPDDADFPLAFVIFGRARCPQGEELSTADRSPPVLVVEESRGGGGDGGGNGDDGDGNDGEDERQRERTSTTADAAEAEEGDETPDEDSPAPTAGAFPQSTGGGDPGDDAAAQDVLGAAQTDEGDDDDSGGKDKNKRNRGDGDGGDEDADDEEGGGGGKNKDRDKGELSLPERAPALTSDPPATSSENVSIPDIGGFGLADALFVALCALGLALVGALAYAGRWLGVSEPVDSEATTQVLRPVDARLARPRGGPS